MLSGGQESTQKMGFVGRCIGGLYFDMFTSNHFSIHDMFTWWSWAAPCLMPRNSKKLAGGLCLFGTSSTFDAEVGPEAATTNRWSSRVLGAVLHSGRGEQWGRQWHVFLMDQLLLYFVLILSHDTWELLRICGCLCNSELFLQVSDLLFQIINLNLQELAFSNITLKVYVLLEVCVFFPPAFCWSPTWGLSLVGLWEVNSTRGGAYVFPSLGFRSVRGPVVGEFSTGGHGGTWRGRRWWTSGSLGSGSPGEFFCIKNRISHH